MGGYFLCAIEAGGEAEAGGQGTNRPAERLQGARARVMRSVVGEGLDEES